MHVVDSKIGIYCSLKSLLRLNVCKIDESGKKGIGYPLSFHSSGQSRG
jgi:hypothetical protein